MNRSIDIGPVSMARSFWVRNIGLMGQRYVRVPLLFPRCSSIHTFFMRIAVDIICLDSDNVIVNFKPNVQPWRVVLGGRSTKAILEAPAGFARRHGLFVGQMIEFEEWAQA